MIVAARATNRPSDKQQAGTMVEETIGNTGTVPREVSADAGYYSARAVADLCVLGIDPFIAPEKTRHGTAPPPAPRGRIPNNLSARDRMRRKLRTKRGRQRYALRMETVEPVFGQIKQGRGIPAVPDAEPGEGEPGVAADLYRAQPAEAVPLWGQAYRQTTWQRAGLRPYPKYQGVAQVPERRDIAETISQSAATTGRNSCRCLLISSTPRIQSILRHAASRAKSL